MIAAPALKYEGAKTLAVIYARQIPRWCDVKTLDESGLPGFGAANWQGVFVPAGTPAPIVARLNKCIIQSQQ